MFPKRLPFTTSNVIVRTFRHAISLDERRSKFKANLWNRPTAQEAQLGVQAIPSQPVQLPESPASSVNEKAPSTPTSTSSKFSYPSFKKSNGNGNGNLQKKGVTQKRGKKGSESEQDKKLDTMEKMYSESSRKDSERPTDIEEVWFAVCPGFTTFKS